MTEFSRWQLLHSIHSLLFEQMFSQFRFYDLFAHCIPAEGYSREMCFISEREQM